MESLSIVGHSNGAYRALDLALNTELKIEKLILLSGLCYFTQEMCEQFPETAAALREGVDLEDTIIEQWIAPAYREANPGFEEQMRQWWSMLDPQVVAADLETTVEGDDLRPRLNEIKVPVYLRVGSADLATPPEFSEEMAALIPNAELDIVDGAGHFVHLEDSHDTGRQIAAFLQR